jgi:hypothetical protein
MMKRRGKGSARPAGAVIAFAWFTRDQWLLVKHTAADREELDDTYEEWLEGATRRFEELLAEGFDIRKVNVEVAELSRWCRSRGVPLDGRSRSEFAAYKAERLEAESNPGRKRACERTDRRLRAPVRRSDRR